MAVLVRRGSGPTCESVAAQARRCAVTQSSHRGHHGQIHTSYYKESPRLSERRAEKQNRLHKCTNAHRCEQHALRGVGPGVPEPERLEGWLDHHSNVQLFPGGIEDEGHPVLVRHRSERLCSPKGKMNRR